MRRFESIEAFVQLRPDDWPRIAVEACRLAVLASGIDDPPALSALRLAEQHKRDPGAAESMRSLAERFDEDAWQAQEAGDDERHRLSFQRARAMSAVAFALDGEPDEAIYEAAHAVGTPEELIQRLAP